MELSLRYLNSHLIAHFWFLRWKLQSGRFLIEEKKRIFLQQIFEVLSTQLLIFKASFFKTNKNNHPFSAVFLPDL